MSTLSTSINGNQILDYLNLPTCGNEKTIANKIKHNWVDTDYSYDMRLFLGVKKQGLKHNKHINEPIYASMISDPNAQGYYLAKCAGAIIDNKNSLFLPWMLTGLATNYSPDRLKFITITPSEETRIKKS